MKGRKVSKVVKTTVVRGERMEKQTGDSSLAADLPSARKDFEKVSVSVRASYEELMYQGAWLVTEHFDNSSSTISFPYNLKSIWFS